MPELKKSICCRENPEAATVGNKYCEIFKNTYFEKHLWTTASENQLLSDKFTKGRKFLNFIVLLNLLMMMMMMMMMMNCFCGMVDRRKPFTLVSSWDQCEWSSTSRISDTSRAGLNLRRTWVQALLNEAV